MVDIDIIYMNRALEMAYLGKGNVSPNPMVGCVIVYNNHIIGGGFHQKYGEAHAEVNAINSVSDHNLLRDSTVYVTLEPCSHLGRTPPCADLLIEKKVKSIVIAVADPNPRVNGKGISILKKAKSNLKIGILEKEAKDLNKRFFCFHQKKRPYIILKWAQTNDGFIARKTFDSKWISNPYSRQIAHKWRTEEDAILVGFNTAKYDNPKLTARDWKGKNPVRVIIDFQGELNNNLRIFDNTAETIVFSLINKDVENVEWIKLNRENFIKNMIKSLYDRNIQSIVIEGGSKTIQQFIDMDLWDETRVFVSETEFGDGIAAPQISQNYSNVVSVLNDKLYTYYNAAKKG